AISLADERSKRPSIACNRTRSTTPYHFFFSGRRRHTRSTRDWSTDVCSSDLGHLVVGLDRYERRTPSRAHVHHVRTARAEAAAQIGRASCRERGYIAARAGARKKKKEVEGTRVERDDVGKRGKTSS